MRGFRTTPQLLRAPMAFGLFKKQAPAASAPAAEAKVPQAPAAAEAVVGDDSAKAILELLDLELGAMIRQLERAANSVTGGAEATAATLSTIRQRTDALTSRTSAAQGTATTFSHAADKFTQSAQGIGSQVRDAGKLADQASDAARGSPPSAAPGTATPFSHAADKFTQSAQGIGSQVRDAGKLADQASDAAREASANVDRLRESSAGIGNVVNLIGQIAGQTTLLALNSPIEAAPAGEAQ